MQVQVPVAWRGSWRGEGSARNSGQCATRGVTGTGREAREFKVEPSPSGSRRVAVAEPRIAMDAARRDAAFAKASSDLRFLLDREQVGEELQVLLLMNIASMIPVTML